MYMFSLQCIVLQLIVTLFVVHLFFVCMAVCHAEVFFFFLVSLQLFTRKRVRKIYNLC